MHMEGGETIGNTSQLFFCSVQRRGLIPHHHQGKSSKGCTEALGQGLAEGRGLGHSKKGTVRRCSPAAPAHPQGASSGRSLQLKKRAGKGAQAQPSHSPRQSSRGEAAAELTGSHLFPCKRERQQL